MLENNRTYCTSAETSTCVVLPMVRDGEDFIPDKIRFHSKLSATCDYIVAGYLMLIGLSSLVLNTFVLMAMYKKRRLLRPVERFMGFLAVNDLCMTLFAFPMPIASSLNRHWMFGVHGCSAYGFMGFVTGLSSIFTLATMSVIRCIKVLGSKAGRYVTKRSVVVAAVGCYVLACLWSTFPLLGWGRYGFEVHMTTCSVDWVYTAQSALSYIQATFLFCVLLPVLAMCISYGTIIRYMKRVKNTVISTRTRITHVTILSGCMCAAAIIAWLPYSVMSLLLVYGPRSLITPGFSSIAALFAKTSVICNPCIYFLANSQFRMAILESVPCLMAVYKKVYLFREREEKHPARTHRNTLAVIPERPSNRRGLSGYESTGSEENIPGNGKSNAVLPSCQPSRNLTAVSPKVVENKNVNARVQDYQSTSRARGIKSTRVTFVPREPSFLDISGTTIHI